jgi:hypothetical protein
LPNDGARPGPWPGHFSQRQRAARNRWGRILPHEGKVEKIAHASKKADVRRGRSTPMLAVAGHGEATILDVQGHDRDSFIMANREDALYRRAGWVNMRLLKDGQKGAGENPSSAAQHSLAHAVAFRHQLGQFGELTSARCPSQRSPRWPNSITQLAWSSRPGFLSSQKTAPPEPRPALRRRPRRQSYMGI